MKDCSMQIRYWGISGSIASPLSEEEIRSKLVLTLTSLIQTGRLEGISNRPDIQQIVTNILNEPGSSWNQFTFGGNTTCVEVRTADSLIILDGGTGLRNLGSHLQAQKHLYPNATVGHIFLSHLHADHISGIPFCGILFDPESNYTIHASPDSCKTLQSLIDQKSNLGNKLFPPIFEKMAALKKLVPIHSGESITFGETTISAHALHHPGGCHGYKVSCGGKSFVFATDHEQSEEVDEVLAEFCNGCDLLYTEGQYLLSEYKGEKGLPSNNRISRKGWGHTPMEWCLKTALKAGVHEIHLGHKDPYRKDEELSQIESYLTELIAKDSQEPAKLRLKIASEGMTIKL